MRLAWMYSTAGIVRAERNWLGQSFARWPGSCSSLPLRVSSSNAAAASACSISSIAPYGAFGRVTSTAFWVFFSSHETNALSSSERGQPRSFSRPTRRLPRSCPGCQSNAPSLALGSLPSAPRIASKTMPASTALRAIGPTLSIVHDSGIAP